MKAVVAGATGLIGSFLINELENDPDFDSVIAITRKAKQNSPKTNWEIVDYNSEKDLVEVTEGADVVFCCLGTTMKKAGSKENFYEVDYQYVINLAIAAKANRVRQFSIISAMGADAKSGIFYNRVKGEMEEAVKRIGFDELIIFHPSLLVGPREESRFGEKVGIILGKVFAPFLFGSMKNYHPIHVSLIAKAMVNEAWKRGNRKRTLVYREILKRSRE